MGKGGLKLDFAIEHFGIDVSGMRAVDLGANVGGFTDCLLHRGATKVYAVDTAYGLLAWKLRTSGKVEVVERTNALSWSPPEPVDIVVMDLGWTRQARGLPAAATMLKTGGYVLSLIKPQYEAERGQLQNGILPERFHKDIVSQIRQMCPPELGVINQVRCPHTGSGGNIEYWLALVMDGKPDVADR